MDYNYIIPNNSNEETNDLLLKLLEENIINLDENYSKKFSIKNIIILLSSKENSIKLINNIGNKFPNDDFPFIILIPNEINFSKNEISQNINLNKIDIRNISIKEWKDDSNVISIIILSLKLCSYYNQFGDAFSFPINPSFSNYNNT